MAPSPRSWNLVIYRARGVGNDKVVLDVEKKNTTIKSAYPSTPTPLHAHAFLRDALRQPTTFNYILFHNHTIQLVLITYLLLPLLLTTFLMKLTPIQRTNKAATKARCGPRAATTATTKKVDRHLLRRRAKGVRSRAEVNQDWQLLPPIFESRLARWVILQSRLGFAINHSQLRLLAQRLLNSLNGGQRLGKHWIQRFLWCNPTVATA